MLVTRILQVLLVGAVLLGVAAVIVDEIGSDVADLVEVLRRKLGR